MYLPQAPSDEEKYAYVDAKKGLLYTLAIMSMACLIPGMWRFSLTHPGFLWYSLFAVVMFVYLAISYFVGIVSKRFDLQEHMRITRDALSRYTEFHVDIFLPTCGEPIEILENTYQHVKKLAWPSERLKVYVLDDGARVEVRNKALEFGYTYITRPDPGVMKKAGNMRYAFARTHGDLIAVFDADFCPRPDFLHETVPYFWADQKTAVVQTPQYFNIVGDWVHKGAAWVQELFYRLVQVNRNHFGASVCVGSNAVYRRVALEPFGGTALIEYSEDLHTGFNCLSTGWKQTYIPLCLAKGVCPDDIQPFFTQQYRWCTGSFSLFLNKEFWVSRLTWMQKLCFVSGMLYYVATALGLILTPIPPILMIWFMPSQVHWWSTILSLPSFLYGTVALALWSRGRWGLYALRVRHVAYWSHLFAICDRLRGKTAPWVPTGLKVKPSAHYRRFKRFSFVWTQACFVGLIVGAAWHHSLDAVPTVAIGCFYAFVQFLALEEAA